MGFEGVNWEGGGEGGELGVEVRGVKEGMDMGRGEKELVWILGGIEGRV